MEQIWRQEEPTTVKLVMDALNRKAKPPRAYTTYMTVMRRLDDKGLLSRRRTGPRRDSYAPTLSREEYRERRAGVEVRRLVDRFGDAGAGSFRAQPVLARSRASAPAPPKVGASPPRPDGCRRRRAVLG